MTLTACPPKASFEITQSSAGVVFAVVPSNDAACPQYLNVQDISGPTVWRIRSETACSRRFVYGVTPAGFHAEVGLAKLLTGHRYEVTTAATGVRSGSFTAE